ncbi:MAG: cytidylate kinase-like family protein [Tannerella sp.]|jgi:cytidylate kinase|nr:cytidylate kinase-like family protein [Tannerella sp.]
MNRIMILTVGRQFGSGGRVIGKKLAESFGIAYYDRELIQLASRESGLCRDVFEKADEKASGSLTHAFMQGFSHMGVYAPQLNILSNEGLFQLQSDAIRKLGETESCVIVGRCADYILREHPHCISFFIHNRMENRIRHVVERQQATAEQARELIAKTDRSRAAYYGYFTNKTWGKAASYDLSIDVSALGIDGTVAFMKAFVEKRMKQATDAGTRRGAF